MVDGSLVVRARPQKVMAMSNSVSTNWACVFASCASSFPLGCIFAIPHSPRLYGQFHTANTLRRAGGERTQNHEEKRDWVSSNPFPKESKVYAKLTKTGERALRQCNNGARRNSNAALPDRPGICYPGTLSPGIG